MGHVLGLLGALEGRPGLELTEREKMIAERVIKEINPDILGVCEMGSPERGLSPLRLGMRLQ